MPGRRVKTVEAPNATTTTERPTDERDTVVMFVDIIGASEVSNHKSPEEYAGFVSDFQKTFTSVCQKYIQHWYAEYAQADYHITARGDEGLLMFYLPDSMGDVSTEVDCAVSIALELKRQWLWSEENKKRIEEHGLLPIGLGIGIHAGKTFLHGQKGKNEKKPEGYAINLAKRVEGFSRNGRFTNIFLSEAAYGCLNNLADEVTYLAGSPETITPKGISRDIRVYEIKHHFLPSDWTELSAVRKRSRSLLDPKSIDLETLERALELNPTNLWLTDEFIRSSMLKRYWELNKRERESGESLRKAFESAKQRANLLRQSEQRDAGAMFIEGLIDGECGDYEQERCKYTEAIKHSDQISEAYWYRGLSFSYEAWEKLDFDTNIKYADLDPDIQELVDNAIDDLGEARQRRPQCAWMLSEYGFELVRWQRTKAERANGLNDLELAMNRLDAVRESARKHPYIIYVEDEPRIRKLLQADAG